MKKLNSEIIICKGIKLNKDYVNVLDYSEEAMLSLCNSKKVAMANDYSFIRNTGTISTNFDYDTVLQCNYMAFQNKDYSNKWFFAFIDDVIYNGEANTEIRYTVDVWSTWFGDWTEESCFVIREHVNDDTIGLHTVPEGLETGEYIIDNFVYDDTLDDLVYIIQTMKSTTGQGLLATNYGGIFISGGAYICNNINTFVNIIQAITGQDENAIFGAYVIPSAMITNTSQDAKYSGQSSPNSYTKTFNKPTTLNNYIPKNGKLLTFPYCYINVSNNNGSTNSLRYEDFRDSNINFKIKGVPVVRWIY